MFKKRKSLALYEKYQDFTKFINAFLNEILGLPPENVFSEEMQKLICDFTLLPFHGLEHYHKSFEKVDDKIFNTNLGVGDIWRHKKTNEFRMFSRILEKCFISSTNSYSPINWRQEDALWLQAVKKSDRFVDEICIFNSILFLELVLWQCKRENLPIKHFDQHAYLGQHKNFYDLFKSIAISYLESWSEMITRDEQLYGNPLFTSSCILSTYFFGYFKEIKKYYRSDLTKILFG